jgi:hypothetical protein
MLSARNVRAARTSGREPSCWDCQHPPKPADEATMERMQRWWLVRYSLDELLEIGALLGWTSPTVAKAD